MFIELSRYDLLNIFTVDGHNLLQAGPHPAAGGHDDLFLEFCGHLHDGLDQGVPRVMRGPISVPLLCAQHKKVQGIEIW